MKVLERAKNLRNNLQIVDLEGMVPQDHLLRKIDQAVDFSHIYDLVEHLYCEDNGRPAVDPVVLVKMVLIQHLFGIKSLRQTVKEVDMNIAYRWFLGYDLTTRIPHFATISYTFAMRFPSEIFENIFAWILEEAVKKGFVDASTIFIDSTHVKANANKKKNRKALAKKAARSYDKQLRKEINRDRAFNGKKPLKDNDDDDDPGEKQITVSTTDPECGLFHKGEHKVEFAYSAHVACDKKNFILDCEVTPGNVHDSIMFDAVYDKVVQAFPEVEIVAIDAGYKTPWICKKVIDDERKPATPYKRPMGKKGLFRPYEYVYDEYYNCVICPNNQALPYTTTNRDGYREFKSDPVICKQCPDLLKCTHSKGYQKVVLKHIWENYIEQAEDFRHSPAGQESYSLRGQTIERVFADAKEKYAMRYTMFKGLTRVRNWVRLKFAAMNLKKLAMWAY
ncbi:MAG: IS1182 family transposase [Syntrophomonas sp.]